jgi:hypothetical protein
VHGRLLHHTPTGDDGFAFCLSCNDQPGTGVDPDLEFDKRLLLHGKWARRVRHLRHSRGLPNCDDFLFGCLHRGWRIGYGDGHCDRRQHQHRHNEQRRRERGHGDWEAQEEELTAGRPSS